MQGNTEIARLINEKDIFVSFITVLDKSIPEHDKIKIRGFLSECTFSWYI